VNNPVLVNGYTDNVPINTALFPSNRYLSAYRAARVADFFESLGIDASRLRPAGLGELYPVASNATAEGRARNRRVEIIVESKLVSQTLEEAGLDDTPAAPAPTTAPIVPVTPVAPDVTGARPDLSPGLGAH
jgi:chemotaxis protein MotB